MSSVLNGPFDAWANRFSMRSRIPMISANRTASVGSCCGARTDARAVSRSHSDTFFPAFKAAASISPSSASVSLVAMDFVREASLAVVLDRTGSATCCGLVSEEAMNSTTYRDFSSSRLDAYKLGVVSTTTPFAGHVSTRKRQRTRPFTHVNTKNGKFIVDAEVNGFLLRRRFTAPIWG